MKKTCGCLSHQTQAVFTALCSCSDLMELLKLLKYSISQQKWAHKAEGAERSSRFDHKIRMLLTMFYLIFLLLHHPKWGYVPQKSGMLPWWDGCAHLMVRDGPWGLWRTFSSICPALKPQSSHPPSDFGFLNKDKDPKLRLQGSQSRKKPQH